MQSDITNLSNGLLLFYIAIATNFIADLYSKPLRKFLKDNRFMHHIIGYLVLLYSISYTTFRTDWMNVFLFTLIMYIWFILTTKMDLIFTLLVVVCLAVGFILNTHLTEHTDAQDTEINKLRKYEKYIMYAAIGITLIGTGKFLIEKYTKFGSNFSVVKFLFYQ